MEDSLPCIFPGIRSDIKSGDGLIGLLNFEPHLF